MQTAPHIRLILWKAAKAIERVDLASISETGLLLSDFTIMEVLLHKGPLPINTIGEKVLLTSGSMTAAVNRLQNQGYVTREKDPNDGRCFLVQLTESGQAVIQQAYHRHAQNLERVADVLTVQERSELVRLLKKIGLNAERCIPK
ncbi:MAG: MarR family transcriptional regulator [Desulfobacteraceae bacterium]|jgi:MarR family 2-MHQ and catechol resistance regulon transcriptional repressor